MGRLEGNVAVITGGASGIGEGTVRTFVREGARVVIADIQDDKGQALAKELGAAAVYQRADVSDEADIRAAVERAMAEFGRLDVMFNNAGIGGVAGPIAQIEAEAYDRTMSVLLRGVFLGMKHAAAVMQPQGSGSIISTASVAGMMGGDAPHVYSTAKAAIIHLTRSVALELAMDNVRVNCICPGGIATPLVSTFNEQTFPIEAVAKALANFQPIRRGGRPDDIANAALWLASDESSFVTGQAIVVDGGYAAGKPWDRQPEIFRAKRPPR